MTVAPPALTHRLAFIVHGTPVPQGSMVANRGGGVHASNGKTLAPWRATLSACARDAATYHDPFIGPVTVWAWFTFNRPASHYYTGRRSHLLRDDAPTAPCTRSYGDTDKLARALLDALDTADIYADDSQVVELHARTVYAGEHENALAVPGVAVIVEGATW